MASSFSFPLPQVHRSPKNLLQVLCKEENKRHPPPCACLLLNLYCTLEKPHWIGDAVPREAQTPSGVSW